MSFLLQFPTLSMESGCVKKQVLFSGSSVIRPILSVLWGSNYLTKLTVVGVGMPEVQSQFAAIFGADKVSL